MSNETFKDIPLLLLRKNIAKGTTDPRVAFISQDHSTEFTYWTYYNLRISAKHQLHTSSSIAENKKSLNSFKTLSLISTNVFLLASVFFSILRLAIITNNPAINLDAIWGRQEPLAKKIYTQKLRWLMAIEESKGEYKGSLRGVGISLTLLLVANHPE